ncbi:hypothetical protein G3480_08820 [Thiorhodococcus mannitoliphagus]|uniref:Outer membrane protein assembly factor BamE n=1 Tax=Thiorhodococcus mannitoliphagus TaxID=329406 RepID=A0A6P1DRA5_9GAMM|nr:hypothetical protein [Thiorhodococcus mannitoliphagus]NEX20409.1 hypothetical protein [Thiorhodococcus mannitoliphagus]
MSKIEQWRLVTVALLFGVVLSACVSNQSKPTDAGAASQTSQAATSRSVPPGMNAQGEVVDSSQIEGGHGKQVTGLNDWEGEITGKSFRGAKFDRLKIGMPMKQVTDLIGEPSDQGAYMTGKAWIPFYFGSDRYRHELVYKNQGRLIFAGGAIGDFSSGHLTWIIYNPREPAYR